MKIEYDGKSYNKIKELLTETTIVNIDKFLFDNEKITLTDFIGLQEKENQYDASGSASNSGDSGSASNSGDWGSASNSGYSGSASNSGDWGSASNSGDSGSASNSGYSGSASNSGDSGSASNSGYSGSASNSGYSGSASNSGYSGSASNSGDRGSASNSGDSGSASNSGDWGSASNSGDSGSASNSGYSGSASNSGYSGSASNSGYSGSASNSGYSGSASNSGDRGSASNSGDWGSATSNSIFGSVSNKENLYAMITEFVFSNIQNGEGLPKEKIIKQNAKLIKFTSQMAGKFYTLLKNKIYEVVEYDGIKMIVLKNYEKFDYKIIEGIEFGNDITIYNKQVKLENIKKLVVVIKDEIASHGDSIKEAIADFRYKISNRDTSVYEYFKTTKEKIKTDEIIRAYRVITGACLAGTKSFVESFGKIKEEYTIKEALKLLKSKNAYGYSQFEKFIKGELK